MAIRLKCPGCGAKFRVDDACGGRTGKCARCGSAVTVPDPQKAFDPLDVIGPPPTQFAAFPITADEPYISAEVVPETERDIHEHSFYSKVAGVSHENPDGSSRQEIIERCDVGERLRLRREPNNRFDPNAIAVLRHKTGEQIGYVRSDLAAELAPVLDRGERVDVRISALTGGGGRTQGVNMSLDVYGQMRPYAEKISEEGVDERSPRVSGRAPAAVELIALIERLQKHVERVNKSKYLKTRLNNCEQALALVEEIASQDPQQKMLLDQQELRESLKARLRVLPLMDVLDRVETYEAKGNRKRALRCLAEAIHWCEAKHVTDADLQLTGANLSSGIPVTISSLHDWARRLAPDAACGRSRDDSDALSAQ